MADRRQLLRLGATGLPMVLTLKASAQQAVVSQLQCIIVTPRRYRILVDCDGRAWVGRRNVQYRNGRGWNVAQIARAKEEALWIFEAGAVPSGYRPTDCPEVVCNPSDDDDDDNSAENSSNGLSELDALLNASLPVNFAENSSTASGWNRGDDDDDDDDDCDPDYQDNGYALYTVSSGSQISAGEYLTGSVSNPDASHALFIELSQVYHSSGATGGTAWPGISCIASILTYLGQQN